MPELKLMTRDGMSHQLDAPGDMTLMEAIRDAGFDELLATCGGCCSCATCHVHLDPESFSALEPPSEIENDLLDSSDHRNELSRLSCQVSCATLPTGAVVTVAQED